MLEAQGKAKGLLGRAGGAEPDEGDATGPSGLTVVWLDNEMGEMERGCESSIGWKIWQREMVGLRLG